jgi:hypothetical protein
MCSLVIRLLRGSERAPLDCENFDWSSAIGSVTHGKSQMPRLGKRSFRESRSCRLGGSMKAVDVEQTHWVERWCRSVNQAVPSAARRCAVQ